MKSTYGALNGYSGGILIVKLKVPPSYGLPGGPAIDPFQFTKSFPTGSIQINFVLHSALFFKSLTCDWRIEMI